MIEEQNKCIWTVSLYEPWEDYEDSCQIKIDCLDDPLPRAPLGFAQKFIFCPFCAKKMEVIDKAENQ